MYAVIKTGGKQYRVQPGDVLVVEKLDGDAGAEVRFDQVLMLGDGEQITVGAPTVADALVTATLVETRRGEKVKIFKKIRRQGYRRTRGHRQPESVLRVMSVGVGDNTAKWDGEVNLTPRAALVARSRGLGAQYDAAPHSFGVMTGYPNGATPAGVDAETVVVAGGRGADVQAAVVEHADAAPAAKPTRTRKPKTDAAPAGDDA